MSESRFPFSFVVVLFFLVWPTTSPAQDRLWTILKDDWSTSWDDAKKNCSDAEATKRWSDIEGCAITIYGLKPPGPEVGSIAPGSSIALGAGLKYTFMHPSDKPGRVGAESDLHFRALYSFTNFSLIEGRYDYKRPAIGQADVTKGSRFEDQITLSLFASRVDFAKQDFYGLGPNTQLSDLALYREIEDKMGASADWPILSWFAAGGALDVRFPTIKGVSGSSTPSAGPRYGEAGAPGVSAQPTFMNYEAYLRFHTPAKAKHTWNFSEAKLTYDRFSDLRTGTFSFNRLEEFASTLFDLRRDTSELVRPWWKNLYCEPIVGGQCSMGQLVFRELLTASYVGANRAVPFYLQSTLGGTDIEGIDTLRGLVDYRLRDPNRILMQAEFYHNLQGPIGVYGFYDVGKVALSASDLSLVHLRHDVGVGVYVKVQNKIVIRGYIGFGAGEGSHPNFKLPSVL
jgi:hypothetical protein